MKLEQAARQALEFIEQVDYPPYDDEPIITALREALAEQATVSGGLCGGCAKKAADGWALYCVECWEQAGQEPVAWMVYTADGQSVYVTDNPTDIKDGQRALPLYTNPVEPIIQEPVVDLSKLRHEDKCCYWGDERFCDCGADSHELLKWYRKNHAPVRTKDLTDVEVEKVWRKHGGYMVMPIDFARAVIAADREKNK